MYINDLIDGLIKFMNLSDDITGPVNLGNPNEISINKLAETILSLTNSKSKISYNKLPEDDPKKRKPNISLAQNTFDWNPIFNLELGLINTINYFKTIK